MQILSKIQVSERANVLPAAGDISSPADGDIWYNSSTGKFRKYQNGAASDLDTNSGGGGLTRSEVTGTSQTMVINNGYIANNAGLVTFTLPNTAAVGEILEVYGKGAGGWRVSQNASQQIHFGDASTLAGTSGYIASTSRRDCVVLICMVANLEFQVINSIGNITVNIS